MSRTRQPPSEFLAQVLTHRGSPDDLPYPNEAVWIIRQHVLDAVQVLRSAIQLVVCSTIQPCRLDPRCNSLTRCCEIQDFPSLNLKVQKYTYTDGKTVPLLMAEGTLPMYYQVCLSAIAPLAHSSCYQFAPHMVCPCAGCKVQHPRVFVVAREIPTHASHHVRCPHTRHDYQAPARFCGCIWHRQHPISSELAAAPLHSHDHVQRHLHTVWPGPPLVLQTPRMGCPSTSAIITPADSSSSKLSPSANTIPQSPHFPG